MEDPALNPYTSPDTAFSPGNLPSGTIARASATGSIITMALCMGTLTIGGLMTWLGMEDLDEGQAWFRMDEDSMTFCIVGYFVFLSCAVMAVVMRTLLKRSAIMRYREADEELPHPLEDDTELPRAASGLLAAAATYTLIGQALMEGPAVINAIFLFVTSNLVFAIPIVCGLVGILLQIPLAGRLRALLQEANSR